MGAAANAIPPKRPNEPTVAAAGSSPPVSIPPATAAPVAGRDLTVLSRCRARISAPSPGKSITGLFGSYPSGAQPPYSLDI